MRAEENYTGVAIASVITTLLAVITIASAFFVFWKQFRHRQTQNSNESSIEGVSLQAPETHSWVEGGRAEDYADVRNSARFKALSKRLDEGQS